MHLYIYKSLAKREYSDDTSFPKIEKDRKKVQVLGANLAERQMTPCRVNGVINPDLKPFCLTGFQRFHIFSALNNKTS